MNVVVTGGGTIAPIDDVRFIANTSSGRFSAMISEACLKRGATVWHIHTRGAQRPLYRNACLDLQGGAETEIQRLRNLQREWAALGPRLKLEALPQGTVAEYARVLEDTLRAQTIDVAFLAMAVSDFLPDPFAGKIDSSAPELVVRCHPAPKVIRSIRQWVPNVYLVGFKLLSGSTEEQLLATAESASAVTGADLTVANDLRSLRDGRHTIHLVRPGQPVETYREPDDPIAERLVERVFEWREGND